MNEPTTPASWHRLAERTYPEIEAILALPRRKVALLPVGSAEAHGPHLPLATDSIISEGMAEAGAAELARRGVEAVVLPTTHYAITEWARGFAGSLTIPAEAAEAQLLAVLTGASALGFDRLVMLSAHLEPGHITSLRRVARAFEAARGQPLVFPDKTRREHAARLTAEFQSGSCHAGQYETSLVLALRPELVRQPIARTLPSHQVPLHERIRAGAVGFIECGMDRAYCGDPAAATAEEGHATLAVLAQIIAEAVLRSFEP
jgi:creatinine amidohydrolase